MRARVSLLLIAFYSTKIIGSLAHNLIIDRKPNNSSSNNKINNIFFNKKIICSPPIEQIENNKNNFYSMIDLVFTLIFI